MKGSLPDPQEPARLGLRRSMGGGAEQRDFLYSRSTAVFSRTFKLLFLGLSVAVFKDP